MTDLPGDERLVQITLRIQGCIRELLVMDEIEATAIVAALNSMFIHTPNALNALFDIDDEASDSTASQRAKLRPTNFDDLTPDQRWEVDKRLKILDWDDS